MVSSPLLSRVQVRLLPSPSAPQVPLATTSAASAVAGRSDAIISTASTKLNIRYIRFFILISSHFMIGTGKYKLCIPINYLRFLF